MINDRLGVAVMAALMWHSDATSVLLSRLIASGRLTLGEALAELEALRPSREMPLDEQAARNGWVDAIIERLRKEAARAVH